MQQASSQGQNGSRMELTNQPGEGELHSRPGHLGPLTLASVGTVTHTAELSHSMRQKSEFSLSILQQ